MKFELSSIVTPKFGILRIGCLPGDINREIIPDSLKQDVADCLQLINEIESLRSCCVKALEILIPKTEIREDRHLLLSVKRQIKSFNGISEKIKQSIGKTDNSKVMQITGKWNHKQLQLKILLKKIEDESKEDKFFDNVLKNKAFVNALSMSGPTLANKIEDHALLSPKRLRAFKKSVFSYLIRSAFKTSPFSSFTLNTFVRFDGESESGGANINELSFNSTYKLNRAVPVLLASAIAENAPSLMGGVKINEELLRSKNRFFFRYEIRQNSLWKEQHLVSGDDLMDKIMANITNDDLIFTKPNFEEVMLISDRDIKQSIRRGFLKVDNWWGCNDPNPSENLLKILTDNSDNQLSSDITETIKFLEEVLKHVVQLSSSKNVKNRVLMHEIKTGFEATYKAVSPVPPPKFRSIVFEDCWSNNLNLSIRSEAIENILTRVSKVISRKVKISKEYIWLVSEFVNLYGKGGECLNVQEFINHSWKKLTTQKNHIIRASSEELLGSNLSNMTVPLTLFLQFDTHNIQRLEESKVIVNLAYKRTSWQSYRHTNGGPHSDELKHLTNDWLKGISEDKIPISINVSGDCNNLQAGAKVTKYNLELEGYKQPGELEPKDLVIRHNEHSGMLELFNKKGHQLNLFYLGATVPMVAWGPRYIYILLNEPFELGRPNQLKSIANNSSNNSRNDSSVKYVLPMPRIEDDDVVLVRATWWVKSEFLLNFLKQHNKYGNLVALCKFAMNNAIPFETYVRGYSDHLRVSFSPSYAARRKPQWIDLRSKHCTDNLIQLANEVEWLVFAEALPRPDKQWIYSENRPHVSEFLIDVALCGNFE